ncbi:MAG: hypothetical protein HY695_03265 [Deltaproteobacteria bacterium]|nr:hypothetical protein [Deltaproteobacteria bacterium]
MSSYHLNRFLFDLKMDESAFGRALSNLEAAMGAYDLKEEEREALRSGDPRQLRQLGAHGMLALYIMRLNPDYRNNVYWTQK